jgi:hypothetical protein
MRTILCIIFNLLFLWGYTQDFCVTYSSGKTLCFEITSSKTVKIAESKTVIRYIEGYGPDLFGGYRYVKTPVYGYVFEGSLVIPATVTDKGDTYTVTEVDYLNGTNLTSVKIPKTVTHISARAFAGSHKLTTVVLPESIESIGAGAFSNCSILSSIVLPHSVKLICSETFKNCSNLQNITLPDSLEEIGSFAFENCSNLQKITLPSSLKKISHYAFKDCVYLREIEIPEGVEELENHVFEGCKRLRTIKLPKSIKMMGYIDNYGRRDVTLFFHCQSLEKIIIPVGTTEYFKELLIYPEYFDMLVEE